MLLQGQKFGCIPDCVEKQNPHQLLKRRKGSDCMDKIPIT